ncbi:amidase [Oceanobacillus sp. CFH 90083]|uniref:amidase n=1 Tax=Oceanobacillus sp. CFH 90083 TaxID=2592336 RepID=UPI001884305C|nr:amidase [Oceanobacillus sp. CFH 90083]
MGFTIDELLNGYQKRQFTPVEMINAYLRKCKERDSTLHSYITLMEKRALEQAGKYEKVWVNNEKMSLCGIPVSFKDAINISGVPTTNGSQIDLTNIAKRNAEVVDTLETAGCITLGKNNMSEYAADVTSKNKYFGDVFNPLNKKRTAGGSSSGSAVAVAADLCIGSIGTDTSGSVRIPAACCGVVGIKPTVGLVGMKGIMPLSWTLDHVGVIANNMADVTYLTEALIGVKYRQFDYKNGLIDLKIGLPNAYFNAFNDNITDSMMELVINTLEKLGAQIKMIDVSFLNNDTVRLSRTIGTSEITVIHNDKYNLHKQKYSKELVQTFERGNNILAFEYLNALKTREAWKLKMDKLLEEVDIMITPTMPILPPYIEEEQVFNGKEYESIGDYMVKYTSPFNFTGHPALTLPSGMKKDGLSVGFQMVTSYYREELLFRVGKVYEQFIK